MQLRPSSSIRAADDHRTMKMSQQLLPVHTAPSGRIPRSRCFPLPEKCIHGIPVIVFFCVFTLWWFSQPVNVVIKDGRIVAIEEITTVHLNSSRVELAILASATSPIASSSSSSSESMNFTIIGNYYNETKTETEAHPVSESQV